MLWKRLVSLPGKFVLVLTIFSFTGKVKECYFVFVENFKFILKRHSKEPIFVLRVLHKIEILYPKFC